VVPATDDFFEEQAGRSLAKSEIVSKYFAAWAFIIGSRAARIAFVDLFCGPGIYEDGSPSTPIMVIEKACQNPRICGQLVSIFNDADEDVANTLRANIRSLSCAHPLAVDPEVTSGPVERGTLRGYASRLGDTPTLLFLDPWGYKGLSLDEIGRFIGPWGSECIFFFNYRRVNAALSNPMLSGPVNALFGTDAADALRTSLPTTGSVVERERLVLQTLRSSLMSAYGKHVLWFRLVAPAQGANYYLVHVTKAWKGYEVMRDIMDRASSSRDAFGVSTFEYNPSGQQSFFALYNSLPELRQSLVADFDGQTMTVQEVFRRHSEGRMFVLRNYRDAIRELETAGTVKCDPPHDKRKPGTLSLTVRVWFKRER
jgi:three-Cys-motif partner protein